jgi:NADH dehydrogenase FAD-containing subunit
MSQNRPHIVILGAGYAGLLAALRLAGRTRGAQQPRITLVSNTPFFVERIRLHQRAAGQTLRRQPLDSLLRGTGITLHLGHVTHIDPNSHAIILDTGTLHYDTLLYALGSSIDRDNLPGVREHAHVLTPESAPALHERLARLADGAQVAICGGGLTGIEAASELAEAFPALRFTLITRETFGSALSARGQAHLRRVFSRLGVAVREHERIIRIERGTVVTERGATAADAILWAGAFSVSPLAADAGFSVNARGQMLVDARLRSVSHADVYAAGDAAQVIDHPTPIRMACATAMPMAAHAADNLAAALKDMPQQPFRFGYIMRCISLGRRDGLIQMVHGDDTPRGMILTGRFAVLVKEGICRFTLWSMAVERRFPGSYTWFQPRNPAEAHISPRDAMADV